MFLILFYNALNIYIVHKYILAFLQQQQQQKINSKN